MDIALLVLLIVVNGIFAMSEIALVSAKTNRLQSLADKGDKSAKTALELKNNPTVFLSTIQIGITAIGILNGIVGEAVLSAPFAVWLVEQGMDAKTASVFSSACVVVLITYFSIVVGELVPKRLAQAHAERASLLIARPVNFLSKIAKPFVFLLTISTNGSLRTLGVKTDEIEATLTEEDIHAVIVEGSETGVIERQEHDIVRKVFRLADRAVSSLMTPRADIELLNLEEPLDVQIKQIRHAAHTVFPVVRGGYSDMLGTVSAKSLLRYTSQLDTERIARAIKPPVYVPESMNGLELLQYLQRSGTEMVFVVDEYGDIQGLVTIYDLFEAMTGELVTPDPRQLWATAQDDGSWLLDALIPISELKDRLGLSELPDETTAKYHTLNGMLQWVEGKLPNPGDITEWGNWRFEVATIKGNRIERVRASAV